MFVFKKGFWLALQLVVINISPLTSVEWYILHPYGEDLAFYFYLFLTLMSRMSSIIFHMYPGISLGGPRHALATLSSLN